MVLTIHILRRFINNFRNHYRLKNNFIPRLYTDSIHVLDSRRESHMNILLLNIDMIQFIVFYIW